MTAIHASEVEVVSDIRSEVGEGPVWDERTGELLWVDILRGRLHRWRSGDGQVSSLDLETAIGAAVPRANGGLVLAVRDGFAELGDDGEVRLLAPVEQDRPGSRMNDGKCDSAGRFWAGTMADGGIPPVGSLYRLDHDGSVHRLLEGLSISNGIAWSLDDARMYFIDSYAGGIDVFDYDPTEGAISNRRRLVEIPQQEGLPDGMTIDRDGFLWVALFGGSCVRRYAPDGRLDAVVRLPVRNVTSCAFGGHDYSALYITSAALGDEANELAGAVLRCRPGAHGLPARRYAG